MSDQAEPRPVEPLTAHEAHVVDRLTRGRPLTDDEIACYLADHQTPLRHATARVGDEIAEQLRDRLLATLDRERAARSAEPTVDRDGELVRWAEAVDAMDEDDFRFEVEGHLLDLRRIMRRRAGR